MHYKGQEATCSRSEGIWFTAQWSMRRRLRVRLIWQCFGDLTDDVKL